MNIITLLDYLFQLKLWHVKKSINKTSLIKKFIFFIKKIKIELYSNVKTIQCNYDK